MTVATRGTKESRSDLALTMAERNELRLALRTYVTDLHMEIAHTDRFEFREELKAKLVVLEEVLRRLGGAPIAMTGQRRPGK